MRLPAIYSTLSVESLKEWIAHYYDFGDSVDITFYCRNVSDTYLLTTAERQFALKVNRVNWRADEAIVEELTAIRHMDRSGVGVALPVPRSDGKWITHIPAPEGSRSAMLYEWARGRAPDYTNSDHMHRYGELVARLHAAGDALRLSDARPRLDAAYLLDIPLQRIRSRLKRLPAVAPSVARDLESLAERTQRNMSRAVEKLRGWGFCHGDIWANNARLDGERLVLFDFDFCGPGWTVFDVATYRWHTWSRGSEAVAWSPFLEGYLRIRPEAEAMLEYLGLFMVLRHLWTTAHFVGRLPETGAYFLSDDDLENLVPICDQLESLRV